MQPFRFEALELSLEIIRDVAKAKIVEVIRQKNPKLADQLTESLCSVPANLGEGRRRVGRDRIQRFRIADGSADESRIHLHTALSWGWITELLVGPTLEKLDRLCAMTWRLTHRNGTRSASGSTRERAVLDPDRGQDLGS